VLAGFKCLVTFVLTITNDMNTIKSNQTLTSRSICDYNCIFKLEVIERKGKFATVKSMGNVMRTKVLIDSDGNEYLHPEKYSMSPIFRAIN
jgi:hypothetical protein